MFTFTPEEKKVLLFIFCFAFCGLALSSLVKMRPQVKRIIYPSQELTKINLNKVNLEELQKLKCISPNLSKKIVEYRNLHRRFSDLEELKNIKGIGPQRYEKLKGIFFVE